MSATAEKLEAAAPRQVSVNGYIDAITGNRVYGWAWDAQQPKAKIVVRLMAGGKTCGVFAADLPREDLKTNGIGDGAHAFEFAIPEGVPLNDLTVLAVCPDTGATVDLSTRAVAGRSDSGGDLRSAVETLTKSHGFMHRKLQAITAALTETRRGAGGGATSAVGASPVEGQGDLSAVSRIQVLEEAVIRLDTLVLEQATVLDAIRHRPTDRMPRLLAAAATVLAFAALVIALVS